MAMDHMFSTQSLGHAERFEYWRDAVCDSYVMLECDTASPRDFTGNISLSRREKLATSFVSGSNQTVRRRQRDIARSSEDCFLVSLQLCKDSIVEQGGRLAYLKPGDFTLYSSINRYQLRLPDDFSQLVVQIPRDVLLAHLPCADRLTALTVSSHSVLGGMISDILPKWVTALEETNSRAQLNAQDVIIDLLVSGFASLGAASFELNSNDQLTVLRAKSFIEENLSDPDLARTTVALSVGLSVRRLNEILQRQDSSITQEIQSARLSRIAADLVDVRLQHLSISQITFAWGMRNFQSFSRRFKNRFGLPPSEYRANKRFSRNN